MKEYTKKVFPWVLAGDTYEALFQGFEFFCGKRVSIVSNEPYYLAHGGSSEQRFSVHRDTPEEAMRVLEEVFHAYDYREWLKTLPFPVPAELALELFGEGWEQIEDPFFGWLDRFEKEITPSPHGTERIICIHGAFLSIRVGESSATYINANPYRTLGAALDAANTLIRLCEVGS